jgi:hypothetical protein
MDNKTRKINFFSITKKMWENNAKGLKGEYPFFEIKELIAFINRLKSNERKFELKGYKTCSLMSATIKEEEENSAIITGIFKSAQYRYRPYLWNTQTDDERPSPKKLSEGEKEKTPFAIKITPDEVYFVLETNGNGITINNIVYSYLRHFNKIYLKSINEKQGFSIHYNKVGRGDFLETLKRLNRTKIVEVYINKSLIGGDGLNFSNRTFNLQRDVVLTLKAEKMRSITETGVDIFNKFNKQNAKDSISKIRIQGKDEDNEDTILDTSFMEKIEFANVSLNSTTGEVQTTEMLTYLKSFLNNL